MRRGLPLLALPCAWMACFSTNDNTRLPDAGISFDASLPDGSLPEASLPDSSEPVDAGADAPAEAAMEAGPQPVVVTVLGAAGPEQGIAVVYEDATGAVTGTGTTSAIGQASQVVAAGSALTVLLGTSSNPQLFTFLGVEPGDSLLVIDRTLPSLSVTVNALPAPPPTGAVSYSVAAGLCSTSFDAAPVTLGLDQATSPCIGIGQTSTGFGAAFPLLVEAQDPQGGPPLGFTFQKNNPISPVDDAGSLEVSLNGSWSTGAQMTTQSLALVNAPEGGAISYQQVSEVADGVMRPLPGSGPNLSQYTTHVGYADFVQSEVGVFSARGAVATAMRSDPPTADGTISLDVSSLATAPVITGASATLPTAGRPSIAWTTPSGTSLSSMTGIVAMAYWFAADDAGGGQSGTWTLVSPATAASIQAPALPSTSSGWAPGDTASFSVVVYGVQGTALPSYAQVRAAATLLPSQGGCVTAPVAPPLPVPGNITLTVGASQGCE